MTKVSFLKGLKRALRGYPADTVKKTLDYYDEMIQDRMEDGLSEEEAVNVMESAESIAAALPENVRRRRALSPREIALLIVGSPIWLPLLVALCAVAIALAAVLLSLAVSLAAIELALAAAAVVGLCAGVCFLFRGGVAQALTLAGAGLIAGGLCCLAAKPLKKLAVRLLALCKGIFRKGMKRI